MIQSWQFLLIFMESHVRAIHDTSCLQYCMEPTSSESLGTPKLVGRFLLTVFGCIYNLIVELETHLVEWEQVSLKRYHSAKYSWSFHRQLQPNSTYFITFQLNQQIQFPVVNGGRKKPTFLHSQKLIRPFPAFNL